MSKPKTPPNLTSLLNLLPTERFLLPAEMVSRKRKSIAHIRQLFYLHEFARRANPDGTFIKTVDGQTRNYSPGWDRLEKRYGKMTVYRRTEELQELGLLTWTRNNRQERRVYTIPPEVITEALRYQIQQTKKKSEVSDSKISKTSEVSGSESLRYQSHTSEVSTTQSLRYQSGNPEVSTKIPNPGVGVPGLQPGREPGEEKPAAPALSISEKPAGMEAAEPATKATKAQVETVMILAQKRNQFACFSKTSNRELAEAIEALDPAPTEEELRDYVADRIDLSKGDDFDLKRAGSLLAANLKSSITAKRRLKQEAKNPVLALTAKEQAFQKQQDEACQRELEAIERKIAEEAVFVRDI